MKTKTKAELRDKLANYKILYRLEKHEHRNTRLALYACLATIFAIVVMEVVL